MRVALFGGSFDPPHRGHVALARLARERLALDRILVAPVGVQPLKPDAAPASFEDRLSMARLAFASEPGVEISLVDAPRSDGKSNYTIDTLETLRRQLTPADALFCILGADSLLSLSQWHRPADVLTACDFIVGARPGFNLADAKTALPGGVAATPLATELPSTKLLEVSAPNGRRSRLYLLTDLAEDVSASDIRAALRASPEANAALHPAVADYIRAHHLYRHL